MLTFTSIFYSRQSSFKIWQSLRCLCSLTFISAIKKTIRYWTLLRSKWIRSTHHLYIYLFNIKFNNILPYSPLFPMLSLHLTFSDKILVLISPFRLCLLHAYLPINQFCLKPLKLLVILSLTYSNIYPTRCKVTQFIYLWKTALHVSGGISTHHQEHIQLYPQHLALANGCCYLPLSWKGWNCAVPTLPW